MNNAVSHAQTDRIEIGLGLENGYGILSVGDYGVGVSGKPSNPDGIGMHTMAYRARLIGGSLKVRTRTPYGTVVICAFPLAKTPASEKNPDHAPNDI